MKKWETLKYKRRIGQAAYRRVDKRNRCLQDEVFGRPQICDCPSCLEAYRLRLFYRKPQNSSHFIPLNQIVLLDKPKEKFPINIAIQKPRFVEPRGDK